MISIVICICTLVLAFYEKKDLLSRPFTDTKLVIFSIIILLAVGSAIKECHSEVKQDEADETIVSLRAETDSLKRESRYLNRLFDSFRIETRGGQLENKNLLTQSGTKLDSLAGSVHQFDNSLQKKARPILAAATPEYIVSRGENMISLELRALNAEAHIKNFEFVVLNTMDQKIIKKQIRKSQSSSFNSTSVFPTDVPAYWFFYVDAWPRSNNVTLTDMFLLAVECTYTDRDGNLQKPFRKIFVVNKQVSDIRDVSTDEFNWMAKELIKMGYWK